MKKIVKYAYTGLLGFCFLVSSPMMLKQILKASPKIEHASASSEKPKKTVISETQPVQETVSDSSVSDEPVPDEPVPDEPVPEMPVSNETVYEFVSSPPSYFDDALMIGDSRMTDIRDYGTLDNADYFCEIGLSTYGLLEDNYIGDYTFSEIIQENSYGKIYIMLGLNQCEDGTEIFRTNMAIVLNQIREYQPDAIIYLMANLHVSEQASIETPLESNENVCAMNEVLESMADTENKIFYLDVNPLFDDEYGYLPEEVSGDGVHPYAVYYPQWCDWLCEHTISVKKSETVQETAVQEFSFSQAVEYMKAGKRVSRKVWGNEEIWLEMQQNEKDSCIILHMPENQTGLWAVNQQDMFAEDWILIN